MELHNQHQCTVSGILGLVLRVSQVYGIAPLSFKKVRGGWRVQVSQAASIYGKIAALLLSVLAMTSLIMDFDLEHDITMHAYSTSFRFVSVISLSAAIAVLLAQAYSSVPRMKNMINSLAHIERINAQLDLYGSRPSLRKTEYLMMFSSFICGHIHLLVDLSIFFGIVFSKNSNLLVEGMFLAFYAEFFMIKVLILQITLIHTAVLATFKHLNQCLKELEKRIRNDSLNPSNLVTKPDDNQDKACYNVSYMSINKVIDTLAVYGDTIYESSDTTPEILRHLGYMFCSLSDIVLEMGDKNGMVLLTLIAFIFLHIIVTSYNLILRQFGTFEEYSTKSMQPMWFMSHIIDMIMTVEPCHQTQKQMYSTKLLISKMMGNTLPEQFALMSELEMFYKYLMMNNVVYTPMMMFQLNRSIIITILGSITTYLVVVIKL